MAASNRYALLRLAPWVVLVGASLSVIAASADRWLRQSKSWDETRYEAVGRYVRENSTPVDRLFVWGNSPTIYLYAKRVMGTRYMSVNYQTGRVWGTPSNEKPGFGDRNSVDPRAWQQLLTDLNHNHPLFIVDAASGGLDKMDREPISKHPEMAQFVARHYDLQTTLLGVPIYRRRRE